ncbi:MAG: CBS domain-containing protein [Candidatus Thorarchaeota archaeon]
MKVAECMTVKFETVDKEQTISKALDILRKNRGTSRLIVVDKEQKPVGIISFRDVADRLGTYKTEGKSPTSMHVSSAMTFPIETIPPETDLIAAAKTMSEKHISSLIVMDNAELKGILTKHDLLKVGLNCKKIKVKDMMTPNPVQISSSERVISARNIMFENKFSALPVVDEGELVGYVDDENIADALAMFREKIPVKHQKNRLHEYFIGQVMKKEPPTIDENAPLCNLVQKMIDTKAKAIFVTNKENKMVGIVSVTDITQAIAEEKI